MTKILVVDDEPQIRCILSVMLSEKGFTVAEAGSGEQAIALSADFDPDVVLLDISLPGIDGLATLRELLDRREETLCIMMTAYGTIRSAIEAIRIGAFDYLTKPFDNDELLLLINRAIEMSRLSHEVEELRADLSARYGFNEIVGISPKLQEVFRTISKVAPVNATVLIEGESGTGKELVARAIHRNSPRQNGPFVPVNCGAIPQGLFEAEFFGYERGAFTDAKESRAGRFEQAQGGTLFLDEAGDLPLDAQVKLLRALQNREVTRLGGRNVIKLDVRVIAATNVDLRSSVHHGKFREDLYWRLNVVRVRLPGLRERPEDVTLIVDHLIDRFNNELGLEVKSIKPDARRLLLLYDWPGNVRELENVICSAIIMCEGGKIRVRDLPPRIRGETVEESTESGPRTGARQQGLSALNLADAVKEATERLEKVMISSRLAEMEGNRTATAESLGISRKSLFNKMRQYNLTDEEIIEESA
jgi:DNA-binding NtrC family response regulator